MTFKEDWNSWSKGDKSGFIIYLLLMITSCVGFIYIFLLKEPLIIIGNLLQDNLGITPGAIYFLILGIGIIACAVRIPRIIEKIFYPDTQEIKEVKELKSKLRNKYSIRLINLKVEELKTKQKLKQCKEEISEVEKDE